MRWTRTFLPTLRNAPANIESVGQQWMVRAGLGRPNSVTGWNHFPLGLQALRNLRHLIRSEMVSVGAEEVYFPNPDWAVSLIGNDLQSWRQIPLLVHQVDCGWSFDLNERAREKSLQKIQDAFQRIFVHAGIQIREVETGLGVEFNVPSPTGPDTVMTCTHCRYVATKEKAECAAPEKTDAAFETTELPPLKPVPTPGKTTVKEVSTFLKVPPKDLVKTLIFRTEKGFVGGIVRGDHELNPEKLKKISHSEKISLATPEEIQEITGGPIGFSGPVGLKIPFYCDQIVERMSNFITGANRPDTHLKYVNRARDFRADAYGDLRMAFPGEKCPRCDGTLQFSKGIRVGHISYLPPGGPGGWNSEYVDAKENRLPIMVATFGFSLESVLTAAVESNLDEKGISWPRDLSPFSVELITLNPKGDLRLDERSRDLYEALRKAGVDLFWDDRELSPGIKFNDADLIGFPLRVVLGKRTIDDVTVDLQFRNKKDPETVPLKSVLEAVQNALESLSD